MLFAAKDVAVDENDGPTMLTVLYRILHTVCRYCFRIYIYYLQVDWLLGRSDIIIAFYCIYCYYHRRLFRHIHILILFLLLLSLSVLPLPISIDDEYDSSYLLPPMIHQSILLLFPRIYPCLVVSTAADESGDSSSSSFFIPPAAATIRVVLV